jgi:hypothetical protein
MGQGAKGPPTPNEDPNRKLQAPTPNLKNRAEVELIWCLKVGAFGLGLSLYCSLFFILRRCIRDYEGHGINFDGLCGAGFLRLRH